MIPSEVWGLLQSAQGDYLGGLAATVTLKLVEALGNKAARRFRPGR